MSSPLIEIGKILGTHGLKGQLKVLFFAGSQGVLQAGMKCQLKNSPAAILNVLSISHGPKHSLVKFQNCDSIEQANIMFAPGEMIMLERSQFPKIEAEEIYLHDLIGLEIFRESGDAKAWSQVVGTYHNGIQDVLQCQLPDGQIVDLPFVHPLVSAVELANRRIIATPLVWED